MVAVGSLKFLTEREKKLGNSFLIQGGSLKTTNKTFVPGLVKVLRCFEWENIPKCMLKPYANFLASYIPDK